MPSNRTLIVAFLVLASAPHCRDSGSAPSGGNDELRRYLDGSTPLPERLSELGLDNVGDLYAYAPGYELYSNGLRKERLLALPDGTTIHGADSGWEFPQGAMAIKTFRDDDGPVETRILRSTADGSTYSAYLWDDGARDAELLDLKTPIAVDVIVNGRPVTHHVPARLDCKQCHESNLSTFIGLNELSLFAEMLPEGITQLEDMVTRGILSEMPESPRKIEEPDDATRRVLGYVEGNCTFCHNGGTGVSTAFDLRHEVFLENTINHPTEGSASASGIRIVPGSPEESILFAAISGETDNQEVKPMPPIGIDVRDHEGIEMFRNWIANLGAQ